MRNDFQQFLISWFQDWYRGSDDGGPDAEARWMENLSYDDFIYYAEVFAEEYANSEVLEYIKENSFSNKVNNIFYRVVALLSKIR